MFISGKELLCMICLGIRINLFRNKRINSLLSLDAAYVEQRSELANIN